QPLSRNGVASGHDGPEMTGLGHDGPGITAMAPRDLLARTAVGLARATRRTIAGTAQEPRHDPIGFAIVAGPGRSEPRVARAAQSDHRGGAALRQSAVAARAVAPD